MNKIEYPKVLIISSESLYDNTNQTSITLNSYFEKWPKEQIAQIVAGQFNMQEHGVSKRYNNVYVLDNSDIIFIRHFFSVKREPHLKGDEKLPTLTKSMPFKMRVKLTLRKFLTARTDLFPYKISNDLLLFIKRFSPDIIYFTPIGYRSLKLAHDLSIKLGIKAVPHFFDDWQATIYTYPFTRLQRKFVLNYLKKFLLQVPACFCISDYMCEEYENKYKLNNCYSLMNCVDNYYGQTKPFNCNQIIKICYCGSLYLQRGEIIAHLCEQMIRNNFPPFEIIVHTSEVSWNENLSLFSKYSNIKFGGYISHDNMISIMLNYDILLHVESFDESVKNYTRYSIATKIPEYLSTGILILAIGPPDIASIKYLKDNEAAIVITDLKNDVLINKQLKNIEKQSIRKRILENANELFIKNHLKSEQSLKLARILLDTCNMSQNK